MNGLCDFGRYPRFALAHLPTPLEAMHSLSGQLASARLFVKRDDCTGLGLGGNKTRKLEFSVGAAVAAGADTLITSGSWQSNHVRQAAAAAAQAGLSFHAVICDPVARGTDAYSASGNLLLDRLFGAELHFVADEGEATHRQIEIVSALTKAKGRVPHVIPLGASNGIGALGYAVCAEEILTQSDELGIHPTAIVLATGSGGTQAGLLAGLRLNGSDIPVIGISVGEPAAIKRAKVRAVVDDMLDLIGASRSTVSDAEVIVYEDYVGGGYAATDRTANSAIQTVAETEGLLLDPVYTGKAMAGLFDLVKRGVLYGDVVFLHTGGVPALFAYADEFAPQASVQANCS